MEITENYDIYECHDIKKVWGKEVIMNRSPQYCTKMLMFEPNSCCSLHFHVNKEYEDFMIITGTAILQVGIFDDPAKLNTMNMVHGLSYRIPAGLRHRIISGEHGCQVLEVAVNDDPDDSYRIIESGKLKGDSNENSNFYGQ